MPDLSLHKLCCDHYFHESIYREPTHSCKEKRIEISEEHWLDGDWGNRRGVWRLKKQKRKLRKVERYKYLKGKSFPILEQAEKYKEMTGNEIVFNSLAKLCHIWFS